MLLYVKRARSKGREYLYFRTGRIGPNGREILTRLPQRSDPGFGQAYASCLSGRTRRLHAQSSPELTVPQLIELYERSPHFGELAPNSQRVYRGSLAYFGRMLPTAPASQLAREDILRLLDGRADKKGAANLLLRTIAAMFKWARSRGHLSNDPCRDIDVFQLGEHEPWPDHLVKAALASEDPRIRLSVHLLLFSAQRIGDVCRMRWTDLFTDNDGRRRLLVTQEKTGKRLEIPLHVALQAELERNPGRIGYILGKGNGRPMNPDRLRESLQAFAAGYGVKIVPHGLRKNAVIELLEAGCSIAETASITGQSFKMVEKYAKARRQDRLSAAAISKWQAHKA